jgi:hypothetical protein
MWDLRRFHTQCSSRHAITCSLRHSPATPWVQIHKSPDGLSPIFVTDYETWEEASRKVHLLALMEGVHAWARREEGGPYCELVMAQHPHAPWPEAWYPFDHDTIDQYAPHAAGVYVIGDGRPTFVGETDDLRARLTFHHSDPGHCLQTSRRVCFPARSRRLARRPRYYSNGSSDGGVPPVIPSPSRTRTPARKLQSQKSARSRRDHADASMAPGPRVDSEQARCARLHASRTVRATPGHPR